MSTNADSLSDAYRELCDRFMTASARNETAANPLRACSGLRCDRTCAVSIDVSLYRSRLNARSRRIRLLVFSLPDAEASRVLGPSMFARTSTNLGHFLRAHDEFLFTHI